MVTYAEGIFIGYRYYDKKEMDVCFPFGHGLSYTSFAYSNLRVDHEKITDKETITVTCDVTNVGSRCGKAVPQLYVSDVQSTVRRPIRELKGFQKVELNPGQTKTVSFELDKRSFAYYEPKCHDWFVESGEFSIEIGDSSRDIRLQTKVYVEGTVPLPFTITKTTTIGQLLRHPKGAGFVQQMMGARQSSANTQNMGEGSDKMVRNMMMEMPLGALVSYGRMSAQQLDGLIAMLNS